MDNKIAQETIKNLDESIEQLNKKKDMTPSDLDTLCKAYKLKMELEGCYMEDEGMSYRRSYGGSQYGGNQYGGSQYGNQSMDNSYYSRTPSYNTSNGEWHAEGSFAPMRTPVTGRYISRDGGMSSHSLKDRMIARLEGMYDEAKTEYEREEIRKEIRNIEANK